MPGPADLPWSRNFGAPTLQGEAIVGGLAGDDSVLAATWTGLEPGPPSPWHLRKFDPSGNPVWDANVGHVRDLAENADGSFIMAFDVDTAGATSILGKTVACSSACAGVARVGADGTPQWVETFEATGKGAWVNLDNLRVAADGRIALTGTFDGTLDLGTGPLNPDASLTIFVAEMTPDGTMTWSRAVHFFYPPAGFMGWIGLDMAVSPTGDVLISGTTGAPVDYGAGVLPAPGDTSGFFARYDPAGNVVHGAVLASGTPLPINVAIDGSGNAVLAARLEGTFDLGGGVMGTPDKDQLYLLKLDPSGHLLSSKPIAEIGSYVPALAVDGEDDAWLCWDVAAPITVAGIPVQPVSKRDVLLMKLDGAATLIDWRQYGTTGSHACQGIRVGPTGVPVIYGSMDGSVDFGQGPRQPIGTSDAFIAKLGPGGP